MNSSFLVLICDDRGYKLLTHEYNQDKKRKLYG